MLIYLVLHWISSWKRLNKGQRKRAYIECVYPALTTPLLNIAKLLAMWPVMFLVISHPPTGPFSLVLTLVLVGFSPDVVELIWGIWHKSDIDGLISLFSEKLSDGLVTNSNIESNQLKRP